MLDLSLVSSGPEQRVEDRMERTKLEEKNSDLEKLLSKSKEQVRTSFRRTESAIS